MKVSHPAFGIGEVIKMLPKTGLAIKTWLVSFAGGALKTEVPETELSVIPENGVQESKDSRHETVPLTQSSIVPPVRELCKERYSIEALRYGLVYTKTVKVQTVGLDDLVKQLEKRIKHVCQNASTRFLALVGPWGSGKTHTLKLSSLIAQSHGLSTSIVETTANHNLARPAELQDRIIKNLVPSNVGMVTGPSVFVEKYCRTPSFRQALRNLNYLRPAFELAHTARKKSINFSDPVINFMAGDWNLTKLRRAAQQAGFRYTGESLHPQPVVARAYRFCALLWEWALVARAYHEKGKGGLLVLLDEAELFSNIERSSESKERAIQVLQELDGLRKKRGCPLLVIFATTGLDDLSDPLTEYILKEKIYTYYLNQPDGDMAVRVVKKVIGLYQRAYPNDIELVDHRFLVERAREDVEIRNSKLREVIRNVVDYLDIEATKGERGSE